VTSTSSTSGVSRHRLRGAYRVALALDGRRTHLRDARSAYVGALTLGEHMPDELLMAEGLLSRHGLLSVQEEHLVPGPILIEIARLDEAEALLALAFHLSVDPAVARSLAAPIEGVEPRDVPEWMIGEDHREALGALGEELVVSACQDALVMAGRRDLAGKVARVSRISDRFGYDVRTPRVATSPLALEVKTTTRTADAPVFRFFLTRHEYETGKALDNWRLVACRFDRDLEQGSVIGWTTAPALDPFLPRDASGRWSEAVVHLPVPMLREGLPPVS